MTATAIEHRLNKLESNVRLYKQVIIGLLAVIGFAVFISFTKKSTADDIMKAKEFQVVDDYGHVYMSLKKDASAGQLDMFNTSGTKILSLTSSDGGAGTVIGRDANGKKIFRMINVTGGGGSVGVYNTNEVMVDEMSVTDRNTGYLEVNNADGTKMLVGTYGGSSVSGILSVYNNRSSRICVLGSDANANGVLNVYNSYGEGLNGVWAK